MTMTVEVAEARVKPALESAARQLSKRYPIQGFRPGKAPLSMVVRTYGEQAVYEIAIDDLGPKIYEEALSQAKVEPYAAGSLTDLQLKPMLLTFTVPLKPEVELGDYRAVRAPYTAPVVSDEDVQKVMDSLRERQATLEPVDRPAQLGDQVVVDINGFLNEGLNPSDFLLADKDVNLTLDAASEWPMPGFMPELVGLAKDGSKKFDLSFADDYANETLRGQAAHWEVTVKEIKARNLPEWNDELAKQVGEYASLEDLKAKVTDDLTNRARRDSDRAYGDEVLNRVVEGATVVYPPLLLEQELDDILQDLDNRLRGQGLTLDDYLKIEKKTRDQLREDNKEMAQGRLKRALVLGRIVEQEGIDLQPAEVVERIEMMSNLWGERADEMRTALSTDAARRSLTVDMLSDRAMQRLMAIARGEEVPALPAQTPDPEAPVENNAADQPVA
jgi:trigger factor